MKRALAVAVLVVSLLLAVSPALAAVANDAPLVPPRPTTAPVYSDTPPLYDQFTPWAYVLEGENSAGIAYALPYWVINGMMVTKAWLVKVAIRVSEYALYDSLYESFATPVGEALKSLNAALWNGAGGKLVLAALALTGVWAVLLRLRGRVSQAWGAIGGSLLILILSSVLMLQGPDTVKDTAVLSREMSAQVFRAVDMVSAATPGNGLLVRANDQAWRALVYQPWAHSFFGSESGRNSQEFRLDRNSNEVPGSAYLSQRPTEVARVTAQCLFNMAAYCPGWFLQHLPQRTFVAVGTLGLGVVYAGAVLALSGGILVAQLSLLIMLALAPVWLMIALWWPGSGLRIAGRLVAWGLAALVGQAVLAATLAVLFLLVEKVALFDNLGWMFQAILIATLAGVAFRYRYAWLLPVRRLAERPEQAESGLLEQLRGLFRGRRPAAVAAADAAAEPVVVAPELLPTFSVLTPPPQVAMTAPEPVVVKVEEQKAGGPAPAQRQIFLSEMQHLRERLHSANLIQVRQSATEAARRDWEEPAPTPPIQLGPTQAAAAARDRARGPVQGPPQQ